MIINAPRSISFAFWISCLILFIPGTPVSAQSYLHAWCSGRGSYTADSKFQDNLNRLLYRRLYDQGPISGFYNTTEGEYPDKVYGLFLCRGDVAANLCQFCIDSATSNILERCRGEKEAIIWYDECLVRHSNRSFFSIMESKPTFFMVNHFMLNRTDVPVPSDSIVEETFGNLTSFSTKVMDLAGNVTDLAISSESLYATISVNVSNSVTLHELAQCTPDISKVACKSCLLAAVAQLSTILNYEKEGARILQPSCNVRYELYRFYGEPRGVEPAHSPTNGTSTESGIKGVERRKAPRIAIISSVTIGSCLLICIMGLCIFLKRTEIFNRERENSPDNMLVRQTQEIGEEFPTENYRGERPVDSHELPLIPLDIIRTATENFSDRCKLGQGGFGSVYKGTLSEGQEIAVKRLSRTSHQGISEFKTELTVIARVQHRNLVRLLGCCLEEDEMLLIYEYMPNKSLDLFLFDSTRGQSLNWRTRMDITHGIARGLLYLLEDSRVPIIHRDLKPSNILLDGEMNPKISDFGIARIVKSNQDQANTNRIVGTFGYMAPEYAMKGDYAIKSDIFSFGVLLLEIVSGRKNSNFHVEHGESLLTFAWKLWSEDRSLELVDPLIRESCVEVEARKCIHIGLLCVQEKPGDRPTMTPVVRMLGGETIPPTQPSPPPFSAGIDATAPHAIDQILNASTVSEVTNSEVSPR